MSDIKRLLSSAYMLGYSDARNDKAIDPIGAIERLTMNMNKSEAYNRGWNEGREALRKELWEDGRDRLD